MAKRKWTPEEVQEYRRTHGAFFYFNREDANIFVPKAFGFGFSLNLGNPLAWIFILAIIGIAALLKRST